MANLHNEVDEAMMQMGIPMDYRLLVIPLLLILTVAYTVNIVAVSVYIYLMFNFDFIIYFCEITGGLLMLYPITYIVFLLGSIFLIPMFRFAILISNLRQQPGFDIFNESDFIFDPNCLVKRQTARTVMKNVIFILSKQLEIMEVSLNTSSILFFILLHYYTFMAASFLYVYLVENIIIYAFLGILVVATPAFIILILTAQTTNNLVSIHFFFCYKEIVI